MFSRWISAPPSKHITQPSPPAAAARLGSHGAFQEIFAANRRRWMTHSGTFPDNALERDYGVRLCFSHQARAFQKSPPNLFTAVEVEFGASLRTHFILTPEDDRRLSLRR